MAMSAGVSHGIASEINVTPLIDVLLVLLIIFMVLVPVVPHGLEALVPQPARRQVMSEANPKTIVVSVRASAAGTASYAINNEPIPREQLGPRLASIFSTRAEKVMFVRGSGETFYGDVAAVIDEGHRVGVDRIGIITPKAEAGQ